MVLSLYDRLLKRELGSDGRYSKIHGIYGDKQWNRDLDIVNELGGHSGCVNALCWSKSGTLLASGSDDQHLNIHTYQPESSSSQFSLTTTVATGHSQNIFSVKFMPHSNDRTLVTAAGDCEVRIFDIEYSGGANRASDASVLGLAARRRGRTNIYQGVRYLSEADTNARIYRSHADRVKRIVTESSPHLFLTCSEDGEVRQWDLRQPSSAYPAPRHGRSWTTADDDSVPPPLISYKRYRLDLNTISCSGSQPHYIALGGAHLHCFLHDRRMLGRDILSERGSRLSSPVNHSDRDDELMGQATQCVRKFAPNGQRRMKRTDNSHITACKISDANPNEMIVSWSGEWIYSFDLIRSPNAGEDGRETSGRIGSSKRGSKVKESRDRKRKRTGSTPSLSPEDAVRAGSRPRTEIVDSLGSDTGEMALRVQYANGQSEDIAIESQHASSTRAAEAQEFFVSESEQVSHVIAKGVLSILKNMFVSSSDLPSNDDTTLFSDAFHSAFASAASLLPQMDSIIRRWRYPIDPTEIDLEFQKNLRRNRGSARRFVQASGTLSRVLAENPLDLSRVSEDFLQISPAPKEEPDLSTHEQFLYEFLKAILLWLDSGIGYVLQGFTRPSHFTSSHPRFPVPNDATSDAFDEVLIPYLLRMASDQPIFNVQANRFEVDANLQIFDTERAAVVAFAQAVKIPFADLSSVTKPYLSSEDASTGGQSVEAQDRRTALKFWAFRVGRGILMSAEHYFDFTTAHLDLAFGGVGRTDRATEEVEAQLSARMENVDPDTMEDVEELVEQSVPMSDIRATAEDAVTDEEDDGDDADGGSERDDDDESDESDEEGSANPRLYWRSAFERRRLREAVGTHVPCSPHTRAYRGHCNVKTVKDVNFFGLQDEYVVSGSDDGNLFIWDKKTTQLVNILEGDGEVVNVVQGHPYEPILAVSGIDHTIKIFSPDARARERARKGIGISTHDATEFSSVRRFGGRRAGRPNMSTGTQTDSNNTNSEPAATSSDSAAVDDEDDETVGPSGLSSKRRMHLEYQITSHNDAERQGGNQEAYITVSIALHLSRFAYSVPLCVTLPLLVPISALRVSCERRL
ncbi:WD repeat-containing protein [Cryomyces antarcticus]